MMTPLRPARAIAQRLFVGSLRSAFSSENANGNKTVQTDSAIVTSVVEIAESSLQPPQPETIKREVLLAATKYLLDEDIQPEPEPEPEPEQHYSASPSLKKSTRLQLAPPPTAPTLPNRSPAPSNKISPQPTTPDRSQPASTEKPGTEGGKREQTAAPIVLTGKISTLRLPDETLAASRRSPELVTTQAPMTRIATDSLSVTTESTQKLPPNEENQQPIQFPVLFSRIKVHSTQEARPSANPEKAGTAEFPEIKEQTVLVKERRESTPSQRPKEWLDILDKMQQEETKMYESRNSAKKTRKEENAHNGEMPKGEYYPYPPATQQENTLSPSSMLHLPIIAGFTFLVVTVLFLILN